LVERFEIDLARAIFLRNETAYRGLESGEPSIPLSEQFYIGGARTLRGFRENQFHGRRVGYSRWEFVIGSRGENGYVFGDGGYVLRETRMASGEIERSDLFRFGYGFGLRTASKLGHVDISFGIGEKLSLRQTKVHVILEETF
jgi:outer membrane protein insertion porin family